MIQTMVFISQAQRLKPGHGAERDQKPQRQGADQSDKKQF